MRYKLQLLVVLFATLAVVSCTDDDNPISGIKPVVTGSGNIVTVSRTLPEFTSVIMNTMGDVNIGSYAAPISLTVDDNILPFITISVIQGVLTIDSDPSKQLRDFDLTVNLTMTDPESITLAGVGNIRTTNMAWVLRDRPLDVSLTGVGFIDLSISASDLTAVLSGVGRIRLAGFVPNFHATLSGAGSLNTNFLEADTAVVTLSGTGRADVRVRDVLTAVISGSGSIYYRGNPTVYETITGIGRVVDVD